MDDDEQSVMKSGWLFQARDPATANAWSPINVVRGVSDSSRTDEDDDRSRRREVTSATG